MQYRSLGATGVKVSALAYGGSSLGSEFRPIDEAEGGAWAPGSEAVRAVWRQDLAELRDSWVWVLAS